MSRLPRWSQHCRAPVLILALQAGPMEVRPTEDGTGYRLVFAAGGGQYEARTLSCGAVASSESVPVQAYGVSADIFVAPEVRISGAIGTHTGGDAYTGTTGGVQLGWERPKLGLGLGLADLGGGALEPSYHLRLGKRDTAHFRVDIASPEATGAMLGDLRMGVAWNRTANARSFGYIGWSQGLYSDQTHPGGFFAEIGLPVSDHLAFTGGAAYRFSKSEPEAVGQLGISIFAGGKRRGGAGR